MTKCVASYSQRRLRLGFYIVTKDVLAALITKKTQHISFKGGCVIRVAKHLKEDWFIVLH